ncbi:type 1 glutamine amidotransferase [Microbacteriaceae bacterium SG_E_30_P1]|uniref:Type 1 glutamine amidotransferase n=1 Tax=Antiquaquibacter oligotrophicus TaxID=2880260 RepID=A0ABT6KK41_9MICO|nr:ThuA domain-containing protein [Antiquaquibacter oligotrophicus]MDH6180316.1 type 1 glutamine amidotransferase [Antiquaquibacter oligotrophicus]UDF13938.1 ThuA domain-containing protein [Antiquaquibacter oligotrophicus]
MKTFYPAAIASAALVVLGGVVAAPASAAAPEDPAVLVFSATAAFRHTECIASGTDAIENLGAENGFRVEATEDATVFSDSSLAEYDAVVFLCTTGNILNDEQQDAFERYIQGGGGYFGVHSASDTEYDWPWYGGLVGAYFLDHPFAPQFQEATVHVEDEHTAATDFLPNPWVRTDEWYNFRSNPRDITHVLLSLDESTYDPSGYTGSTGMGDHPIAWCHPYDGGRSVYTAMGHSGAFWSEPLLLQHMLGGIQMAAGYEDFRCFDPVTFADLADDNRGGVDAATSVVQGTALAIQVGADRAGETLEVHLFPVSTETAVSLGTGVVAEDGTLSVIVPADFTLGAAKAAVLSTDGELLGWDDTTVVAPSSALAATGIDAGSASGAAALLLLLGAAVTLVAVRRRSA